MQEVNPDYRMPDFTALFIRLLYPYLRLAVKNPILIVGIQEKLPVYPLPNNWANPAECFLPRAIGKADKVFGAVVCKRNTGSFF